MIDEEELNNVFKRMWDIEISKYNETKEALDWPEYIIEPSDDEGEIHMSIETYDIDLENKKILIDLIFMNNLGSYHLSCSQDDLIRLYFMLDSFFKPIIEANKK